MLVKLGLKYFFFKLSRCIYIFFKKRESAACKIRKNILLCRRGRSSDWLERRSRNVICWVYTIQ